MTSSYYLWKWADNDLPGQPNEVFSELLHGRMHPAIQTFDPTPVVRGLKRMSAQGRPTHEEWDWQIHQAPSGQQASFIFLTCPTIERYGQMRHRLYESFLGVDISGYDEQRGLLMYGSSPKISCWECGDSDDETTYDIAEDDLPILLRRIRPDTPISYAFLENRRGHFVTCAAFGRRFDVEWRGNYDLADNSKFGHWRAGYFANTPGRQRLFVPEYCESTRVKDCVLVPLQAGKRKHELILYRDTLRIFRAFLRGGPRPPQYRWQDIKDELP